ncbi:MAG: MOSC domain-containing protein [Acidimicrobiia bacterium]|nr:MOSC domain-containing protein [Acidimicrobiia bacterium]NNF89438.1 MOSC domain-containing protein [Acidimicrobiia bacterium]NNL13432.1 MOSC domain-containing protein [Acidimicrobiia bacterium]RZV41880.1 MAG: MOSC domain-containing protein [Acidimicrobiia bacterium]
MAHVTGIHISEDTWPGRPHSVEEVEAIAGQGLVGDRKFGARRQISIVSTEELDEAAAKLGDAIPMGSTRRQITISEGRFTREPGSAIRLGDVVVEVAGDCSPCDEMEESVGPGARAALVQLGGVVGAIVEGGVIRVGDPVEFE